MGYTYTTMGLACKLKMGYKYSGRKGHSYMIMDQFRLDIKAFLKRTGLSRTKMGRLAVNDPHAVLDWLADEDSDPRVSTVERVYDFMHKYELDNK
jgi:hypothetical protein